METPNVMTGPTTKCVAALFATAIVSGSAAAQARIVSIGTGSTTGVYQIAGETICRLVNRETWRHSVHCQVKATGGSIDNIGALQRGEIEFGIVQSDVQYLAVKGRGHFKESGPHKELRAVFAVYPEPLMVLARDRSGVTKFEDFKGKRFNVGNPGSGTRATVDMLLAASSMKISDFSQASELSPDEHGRALCENRIDGFGYVVGNPTVNLQAITKACSAHLIPLSGPSVDRLVVDYPYFAYTTIAGGTYPANREPIRSFGVVATFVTSSKVPNDTVYTVVSAVFEHLKEFRTQHPSFASLHPMDTVHSGLTAPLHDGAFRYFREKDWIRRGD